MTPQERDLITSLLTRLQQAGSQSKDPEADDLIRRGVAAQPDAPYLMAQTVLIQDMALNEAHRRIKDLEQQVAAAPAGGVPQPGSFLGNARASVPSADGPWGSRAPQPQAAPAPGPVWTQSGGGYPQTGPAGYPQGAPGAYPPIYGAPPAMGPIAAPGASSGFLRQAATTAAGVAGGALLFEGISSLFGPHYGSGFLGGMSAQPGLGETVVNNYYDSPAPGADNGGLGQNQNADWGSSGNDANDIQADQQDFGGGGQDASSDQDFGNQDFGGGDQDFGGGDSGSSDI